MNNPKTQISSSSKKELKNHQSMSKQNDFKMYFQSQPTVLDQMSHLTSKHFADKIVSSVDVLISMGELDISRTRKKVDELMDHTKIGEEQSRALQLKAKKQYIQQQLQNLRNQTSFSPSNSQDRIKDSKVILSKQDHKKLVVKLKKDREERQKHHMQYIVKLEKERQEAQQMQKKSKQESKKQQLRRRRELIEFNLEKNKKNHQQFLRVEHESKQKLKSLQTKKFVYQQIEENYQKTIVLPNLEQKKKKLKELRQYKSFHAEQLNQHQKNYLQHQKLQQSRRSQIKQHWRYRPPAKSERLEIILEEERLEAIQKLQEKKKQLQDKISRQQNYVSYLREHFHPKVDPVKEEELRLRVQKSRITKPEERDIKEIGMGYLEQAKRMRKMLKSIQQRPETERNTSNITSRTLKDTQNNLKPRSVTNYLTIDRNRDEHFYEQLRRKRLEKLTKEEGISESDRIKQLKIETDKINEKMNQKERESKYKKDHKLKQESLDLLLSSIQAKIGIIEMYQ